MYEFANDASSSFRKSLLVLFSLKTVQELFDMRKTSPYADTCIARRRIRMSEHNPFIERTELADLLHGAEDALRTFLRARMTTAIVLNRLTR